MLKVIFTTPEFPNHPIVKSMDDAVALLRTRLNADSVDLFILNATPGASFNMMFDEKIINLSIVTEH